MARPQQLERRTDAHGPVDDESTAPSDRAGRIIAGVGSTVAAVIGGTVGLLAAAFVGTLIVALLSVTGVIPSQETAALLGTLGAWIGFNGLGVWYGARTGRHVSMALQARQLRRLNDAPRAQLEAHGIGGAGSSMAVPVQSDTRVRR